jgi:hypothetical protein
VLHPLHVLGVGDQAAVEPVPVAGPPGLHGLDVGVDLALLGGEVVDDDPRVAGLVVELGAGAVQRGDLGDLGQRAALVPQLVGAGVELLDLEQLQLGGGVGSQRGSSGAVWGVRRGTTTGRCAVC